MPFLTYLFGAGGLALGLIAAGLVQEVRLGWAEDAARSAEIITQTKICDGRIADIKVTLADDALAKVDAANSSIASLVATPDEPIALQKLCDQETACRDLRAQP